MPKRAVWTGFVLLAALASTVRAAAEPDLAFKPDSGSVTVENFVFNDGEKLPALKLHYLTLGTPRRNGAGEITNAVLLLHGTTGSADSLVQHAFADPLFAPGAPLDLANLFVVIPDGIGAGTSSKPSDALHAHFPRYGYRDQVRAQHDLLARIGVKHLKLVLGTSMGGMQTWLWGEDYPDAVDALVPIASTPAAITGRNMIWREMVVESIRNDPDWKGGEYSRERPPHDWIRTAMPLFAVMTGNAEQLQKAGPTRAAAIELVAQIEARARSQDANDLLYAFESSADYDPRPRLGTITKPVLAINFADDLLNPPEFLNLPKAANIEAVMLPGGAASFGHQTLAHADRWAPALRGFLERLPGWR